ncbi:hypothetical protein CEXT_700571 [Caerostris extrusa]|uniref:Uncharacterized protein n=1 Tax=Caerostris extrusa TaxID=172846 RepID=A0AAV4UI63_CAEEX|nr:hypothetical protein CEXT_700571 [Caerostris extrusa]
MRIPNALQRECHRNVFSSTESWNLDTDEGRILLGLGVCIKKISELGKSSREVKGQRSRGRGQGGRGQGGRGQSEEFEQEAPIRNARGLSNKSERHRDSD